MDIELAYQNIKSVCVETPLQFNTYLSTKYNTSIYLKREDQQVIRSYKIRGAYNKISSLTAHELTRGVVCASAGNHAQGVAYTCHKLQVRGSIYMPANTPMQKIVSVKKWGGEWVDLFLHGETYDECYAKAREHQINSGQVFVPPFDDERIIEGQGTVALELDKQLPDADYVILPVGGGGLAAGFVSHYKNKVLKPLLIGAEPAGAASMAAAMGAGEVLTLPKIDPFVDGAAVSRVGNLNFEICKEGLFDMVSVPEGKVAATLLDLYNHEGIVTELAGALAVAALDMVLDRLQKNIKSEYTSLDQRPDLIAGKKIVCIISGGNNDARRIGEIAKIADSYEGLHHHLIIRFKHIPDGLTELFTYCLGPENYVTRLEYDRREHGRSTYGLVSIRSASLTAYDDLLGRMNEMHIDYQPVQKNDFLFKYLV